MKFNQMSTEDPIKIIIIFFLYSQHPNLTVVKVNDTQNIIDPTKKIGFLIHGWIDSANRTWIREAASEWTKYQDINVFIVDWSRLANYEYTIAANTHTRSVGAYVAVFINYLTTLGIKLDDIIITGHSLGGQIAGFAGAALNGKIGQIIALDPAGPLFTFPLINSHENRLDKSDAQFVQVIHTSGGLLGVYYETGHVDFYPNDGIAPQIGCFVPLLTDSPTPDFISCSHFKANSYFIQSLNPAINCKASKCSSFGSWFLRACIFQPTDQLGIYNSKK